MSVGKLLRPSTFLSVLLGASAFGLCVAEPAAAATIIRHDLTVELRPASHELIARDQLDVEWSEQETAIVLALAATLEVRTVEFATPSDQSPLQRTPASFTTQRADSPSSQRIVISLPPAHGRHATLWVAYQGIIDDPPKEPRHLRFVTPSETAGHIGPEGVYLSSESQWYPASDGSLSRFRVSASVPAGWTVVTQGKQAEQVTEENRHRSTWVIDHPSEALTLVANAFVVKARDWKGANGQRVELATYFFADNAGLADEYLEATARYLDAYVRLLGDYPFEKFAVVENFFASGLGMPSFTLLGSGSIKRHYVQSYALGHEIVHSWIGNSVFNRAGYGNWVEGLTTYLANYYWHELARDDAQAREQRRLMIHSYSLYVAPHEDYPVARFTRKSDERDNAIGYQKAAFVFHLLRQEVGEEAFWGGLKQFVSRFRDRAADWGSLEAVFAQVSGRDLRWFFTQWVEQRGAPVLHLGQVTAREEAGGASPGPWRLTVQLHQESPSFRMQVPLEIATTAGMETRWVSIDKADQTAEVVLSQEPRHVRLDPDYLVFRRMARADLPPMLNGFVTDRRRTVVKAFSDAASPLNQVLARLMEQDGQPQASRTVVVSAGEAVPATGSLLVLGGAEQRQATQSLLRDSCGDRVTLAENGVAINGQMQGGPMVAVLVSCHRAGVPGSVLTVLYGVTPPSVAKVSRLLFYYGWHSAVIFRDGAVTAREVWERHPETKEVQIHANR